MSDQARVSLVVEVLLGTEGEREDVAVYCVEECCRLGSASLYRHYLNERVQQVK